MKGRRMDVVTALEYFYCEMSMREGSEATASLRFCFSCMKGEHEIRSLQTRLNPSCGLSNQKPDALIKVSTCGEAYAW